MSEDLEITEIQDGVDKLIIAEGGNDVLAVRTLVRRLELAGFQVGMVHGKNDFFNKLQDITTLPYFDQRVKSVAVVSDADQDPDEAFRNVCKALRKNKNPTLQVPSKPFKMTDGACPRVGVLLWPDCKSVGMLETVCLESVSDDPVFTCLDSFFVCVESQGVHIQPHRLPKARAHAFLATREEPAAAVGQGFRERYWNLDHRAWDCAKAFLRSM